MPTNPYQYRKPMEYPEQFLKYAAKFGHSASDFGDHPQSSVEGTTGCVYEWTLSDRLYGGRRVYALASTGRFGSVPIQHDGDRTMFMMGFQDATIDRWTPDL